MEFNPQRYTTTLVGLSPGTIIHMGGHPLSSNDPLRSTIIFSEPDAVPIRILISFSHFSHEFCITFNIW